MAHYPDNHTPIPRDPSPPNAMNQDERNISTIHRSLQQDRKAVRAVHLILVMLTTYFFALNIWYLIRAMPGSFLLEFQRALPHDFAGTVSLELNWNSPANNHPELSIRMEETTNDQPLVAGKPHQIDPTKRYWLQASFPPSCDPGVHNGQLALRVQGFQGEIDIPPPMPITFGVTANWYDNWKILANWAAVAAFLWILLYAGCWFLLPRPKGRLIIEPYFPDPVKYPSVPLRARWTWLLFPWRLPQLPLSYVLRNVRGFQSSRVSGEIMFLTHRGHARLCLDGKQSYLTASYRGTKGTLPPEQWEPINGGRLMYPDILFLFEDARSPGHFLLFRYVPDK